MNNLDPQSFYESLFDDKTSNYIASHEELSSQVEREVFDKFSNFESLLDIENPFDDERQFIKNLENKNSNTIINQISSIKSDYNTIVDDNCINFDFYESEIAKCKKIKNEDDCANKKKAISGLLIKEMHAILIERENAWIISRIDEFRKELLKQLKDRLDRFKKLERVLSQFIGKTGLLWDMSVCPFHEGGFELLEEYADLLEREDSLMELAKILGKHRRSQLEFEKEMRAQTCINTVWNPRPAYKGQIAGICTSNDISSVLPSELALYKNSKTKKLFEKKFAEKNLLSFKYTNYVPEDIEKTITQETDKEKEEQKGPIIICVDTSGSMSGTPENIAKTITFAISKIAIEEKRKCYLISFSTGIQTLDLSDFKGGDSLNKLISFLRMGFYGGTDALPALSHSLEMLKNAEYKTADVLMISDFVMGDIDIDIVEKIEAEQQKGCDFHSLVIGSSGNNNTIKCFNHNWSYNTNDAKAGRKLIEQLNTLKNKQQTPSSTSS